MSDAPTPLTAAEHFQRGMATLRESGPSAAVPHLQAAVAAEPASLAYRVGLIDALIEAGHPALADDMLQQALALGLARPEAQVLAARISIGDEPEQQELNMLVGLFQAGATAQLEKLAAVMARRYPDCGLVWKIWGTSRMAAGHAAEAAPLLERAAALLPHDADVRANLGTAYRAQGRLAEAEAQLQHALRLAPQSALAHASLGNVYRQQRRARDAQASYAAALAFQPDLAGARQNLGVVLAEQGDLAAAEAAYRQALAVQPGLLDGYVNLATLLQNTGRLREGQELLANALRTVSSGQWMLAALAMTGCWLLRDAQNAQHLFNAFRAQAASEDAARTDRPLREYFWLCARLFDTMAREPRLYADSGATGTLAVIGESHSLAPAQAVFDWVDGPVRAHARLVKGVKMHHLAAPGDNGFKAALRVQLATVPEDAHVLLTIGEIDCRVDEGLWVAQGKGKGSLDELVPRTVDGYLAWVEANVKGRSVTLQGVPMPRRLPVERDAFVAMVAEVNRRLGEGCARRGWGMLDVFAATEGAQGAWHIDDFHLKPGFYAEAGKWRRG